MIEQFAVGRMVHGLGTHEAVTPLGDALDATIERLGGNPAVRRIPGAIVGLTARGKVGRDAPMVGVDPLDMPGPAQRLQAANMGPDEGGRVPTQTLDRAAGLIQMLGWTETPSFPAIDRILRSEARGPVPSKTGSASVPSF